MSEGWRHIEAWFHDFPSDDVPDEYRDCTNVDCRWARGFLDRAEKAEQRIRELEAALEEIVSEDWRGNEPNHIRIARDALGRRTDESPDSL